MSIFYEVPIRFHFTGAPTNAQDGILKLFKTDNISFDMTDKEVKVFYGIFHYDFQDLITVKINNCSVTFASN